MTAVRVLDQADAYCPKCGHNRDKSSVSSIDHEDGRKSCQMCGATWRELAAVVPPSFAHCDQSEIDEVARHLVVRHRAEQLAKAARLAALPAGTCEDCEGSGFWGFNPGSQRGGHCEACNGTRRTHGGLGLHAPGARIGSSADLQAAIECGDAATFQLPGADDVEGSQS